MLLMFIGASPGSTGGGVKTTTIGVLFASMWGSIRGRNVPVFKGYSISHDTVFRAIAILFMFFVLVLLASFILLLVEPYSLRRVVFEVISALGTVGLSTGITPQLTSISKVVLLVLMFLGKIGPLTVAYNMFSERYINRVQYPEGRVVVG
ncbi:MAG: TrkH family potassium uptake protein, partial [Synergistetes bacterium]|nr:TrkH family potassium uptake protein [Synergistota bacterium]